MLCRQILESSVKPENQIFEGQVPVSVTNAVTKNEFFSSLIPPGTFRIPAEPLLLSPLNPLLVVANQA